MSPQRAWLESAQAKQCSTGAQIKLSPEESAHVVRSQRARRGDVLILINGEGLLAEGKLISADGDGAMVEVVRTRTSPRLTPEIHIAQGMPKGGTMDDLVRNVCEAGVSVVIPLETARCELKLDEERKRTKMLRWHQQAIEACKQSGNPWLAHIETPLRFAEWIEKLPTRTEGEIRLLGSLDFDAVAIRDLSLKSSSKILWLIGPEGDLTSAEQEAARVAGFIPVSLGPTVLRAENAALACVAITQALAR
jgi:16S rRNA (uracil1498-N3)-methyltransferase